ncbi:hypothetical protein TWF696_002339 [Orbilia brochopaga]|uniref:Uncharacterized protein n=1 Tax=Orbilia brochopaga TaxID=3140254 RepID=A0AAV9U6H3_9PEZI
MISQSIALTAAFAAVALGAALPAVDSTKGSLEKRDHIEFLDIWQADNATEKYSRETDDAWKRVHLRFPMTIFGKSDTTVYFSMNGLISLGKPGIGRVLPSESCTFGSSCLPDNTLALDWTDLYIPPESGSQSVAWTYHDATLRPDIREHYHISWNVCAKGQPATATPGSCGDAARSFNLNYYKNKPGVFYIQYSAVGKKDFPKNYGVIGAQSLTSNEKLEFELPSKPSNVEEPFIVGGVDYSRARSCVIIDTNKKTVTTPINDESC